MESVRKRLERLEQQLRRTAPLAPEQPGGLAEEVREIDKNIARLEAEIAEAEADMTHEELARSRAEFEEFDATLVGLSLDEKIEALEAEIAAEEGRIREGERWET
jgi:peptidoglycan hydrolase CwlO-like protein